MDKKQVINIVKDYKNALAGLFPVYSVYLFGSYSKGTAKSDSDIDVAVVVTKLDTDWLSASSKLWQATWDVNNLIEPVLLEQCNPSPLYEDVMRTGIAV